MRKSFPGLIAVVTAMMLIATACSKGGGQPTGAGSGTPAEVIQGGILRVAGNNVDSLNPYRATDLDPFVIFTAIYPLLVISDPTTRDYVGDLATSWDVSPDGKTWTFKTRTGAEWSDGTPMTAKDVAATVTMNMAPGSGGGGVVSHMTKAEAPDDTTVVLTYERPVGNVLSQLEQIPILPAHVWGPIFDVKALRD
jgi:peptide/nickel transport system substrate-binding protein